MRAYAQGWLYVVALFAHQQAMATVVEYYNPDLDNFFISPIKMFNFPN